MKYITTFSLVSLCTLAALLPAPIASAEDLNSAVSRLKSDLGFLASDDQEGRDSGSPGIRRAADFIVQRFEDLGLVTDSFDGGPFQEFTIPGPPTATAGEKNRLVFNTPEGEVELKLNESFTPLSIGKNGAFEGEVVFAGFGITAEEHSYDDYADLDVKGKIVIALRKEPQQADDDSVFDGSRSSQYAYFSTKQLNAALHNAACLILVNDRISAEEEDALMNASGAGGAMPGAKVPTIFALRESIDPIVKQALGKTLTELEEAIDEELKPQSAVLEGITATGETEIARSETPVRNVIAVLPGSGSLSSEFLVVGAHYDHVGMGGRGSLAPGTVAIHNGADDNGSGTTTLLEVARRMAEDKSEDRRTIIFMLFTAEEKGLLGSKHYVRNPRWPLEDTVAMVNMDMVGRLTDNSLIVYGTGTAKSFDSLVDRLNEKTEFLLDKQPAGFGPSDHSSFYQAKIPVFHIFTGLHNDYHRPSDDPDTVNYEGMARIANFVTDLVTEISTAPERPEYVQVSGNARPGRAGRSQPQPPRRAVLGVTIDLDAEGVTVETVTDDGAASKAGLKTGDKIVKIDEQEVSDFEALRSILGDKRPGNKIKILVERGEEELELEVTLGRG